MQDFTKPFKLKNEVKQLELNIPNQPKVGFGLGCFLVLLLRH
jgi:hypothetical protein